MTDTDGERGRPADSDAHDGHDVRTHTGYVVCHDCRTLVGYDDS